VLAQAPGPERMHIEVVDDCSTKDDPGSVVRELGAGRVAFYRRPANGGVTANFNTCLERSRGRLVHILHGDDYVLPGFYAAIENAATRHPDTTFLATRVLFTDEDGYPTAVSPRLRPLESPTRSAAAFYYDTPVQFAGIVVHRSFYETHGGFRTDLAHVGDREMWIRAISRGGGVLLPDALAAYRIFDANDTARLRQTADNLRDHERLNVLLAQTMPDFNATLARQRLLEHALGQYWRFVALGNRDAARNNLRFWKGRAAPHDRVRFMLSCLRRRLARRS